MNISIIIPTFHSGVLAEICIKSFIRFCPSNISLDFIVVENSDDISYKSNLESIVSKSHNIAFVSNPTNHRGSEANADAIHIGLKTVKNEWIFIAHCDTCVTSEKFYDAFLSKIKEGYMLIGTYRDINRIHAIHVLGLMAHKSIVNVDYFPAYKDGKQIMDVGDRLTVYCEKNNIKHYCFNDTFGGDAKIDKDSKFYDLQVCRTVYNNEVIYMHLGRGIPKTFQTYNRKGGVYLDDWVKFCNDRIMI